MTYQQLWKRLTPLYEAGEAQAIARLVLDVRFRLSMADILSGKDTQLSPNDQAELEKIAERLEKAEPVQYVLGRAEFCGRTFCVAPGVLIPRPETEELCRWILETPPAGTSPLVLDIGTGSGCIAITLALGLMGADVTAWDISDDALRIACGNAARLGARVRFEHRDALCLAEALLPAEGYALMVSNPPYICEHERAAMHRNVIGYEPAAALFVPDDDPLCFYRSIGLYAIRALRHGGALFFEINPHYADELLQLLETAGFSQIEKRADMFGKERFIKVVRP